MVALVSERIVNLADAMATHALGVELGRSLTAGSILLLYGNLGSGKTTLVQGLAAGLEIGAAISSPTFAIVNEYLDGRLPLYHLDLYRLNPAEVEDLNLESYWSGIEVELGVVAIEWAERLTYLPDKYMRIELSYDRNDSRIARILSRD